MTNERLQDMRRCHMENTGVFKRLLGKVEQLEVEISCCAKSMGGRGAEEGEGQKQEDNSRDPERGCGCSGLDLQLECDEGCPDEDDDCICQIWQESLGDQYDENCGSDKKAANDH
jgi:hypothetical protein